MLEWINIPLGQVTLEEGWIRTNASMEPVYSTKLAKTYDVKPFSISKYPVTVAQYQEFIADQGYENEQWWQGLAQRITKPSNLSKDDNLPRTSVSWYESIAFCRWLSVQRAENITLPNEIQWQRAGQGEDSRAYPWGSNFDQTLCNTSESRIHETTPVDRYPLGQSPFGVFDLSGNVYEWCLNTYDDPLQTDISGEKFRASRGGAYGFGKDRARVAFRTLFQPSFCVGTVGFRVVLC